MPCYLGANHRTMRNILLPGLLLGVILLATSYIFLYATVNLFPELAWEYFGPAFHTDGSRNALFFIHPFLFGLAIAWLWTRIKGVFRGAPWLRGLEFGIIYTLVATLPAMWITFSAIDISVAMVLTWLLYGAVQASLAGWVLARWRP